MKKLILTTFVLFSGLGILFAGDVVQITHQLKI